MMTTAISRLFLLASVLHATWAWTPRYVPVGSGSASVSVESTPAVRYHSDSMSSYARPMNAVAEAHFPVAYTDAYRYYNHQNTAPNYHQLHHRNREHHGKMLVEQRPTSLVRYIPSGGSSHYYNNNNHNHNHNLMRRRYNYPANTVADMQYPVAYSNLPHHRNYDPTPNYHERYRSTSPYDGKMMMY